MYPDVKKNIWCHYITLQVDFALFGLAIENAKADSVALECWGKNTYIPSWAVGWMSFPSSKIQTSYLEAGLLVKILVLSLEFHGICGVVQWWLFLVRILYFIEMGSEIRPLPPKHKRCDSHRSTPMAQWLHNERSWFWINNLLYFLCWKTQKTGLAVLVGDCLSLWIYRHLESFSD